MSKEKKDKTIDIICPLYNAEKYLIKLHESILQQKRVNISNIKYILTESSDGTEDILKSNSIDYKKIKKNEFSHSLVREQAVFESNADVICFITQDIEIYDDLWLYNLTKDIDDDIVACYSRQLPKYDNIEKYTRERNYPAKSSVVSKNDIVKLGLRTFFFSDASSAINRTIFIKLNGYDQKKLPISEDMYFAYKVIMGGYKIKYCANSQIIHSHQFTLKQIYDRYKLTGNFFKENNYLDQYGTNGSGLDLAKYILKRIIQDKKFMLLFRYPFDMLARFIGMKVGKHEN